MEEKFIVAERVQNSCEKSSYNPCFPYSLWLGQTQMNSLLWAAIIFLDIGNFVWIFLVLSS